MLRKWLTTLSEVSGLALIVTGIAEVSSIAGLIAGGSALILLGVRLA